MTTYRNLLHRLPKPALNRGRVQKAARRVLLVQGGEATTRDVIEWAYCRKIQRGRRIAQLRHRRTSRPGRHRLPGLPVVLFRPLN
jgi:hypothetical protein